MDKSETAFRKVLLVNENNPTAAYNLSIIVSSRDLNEACSLSEQAMNAAPDDPKFAYTYVYFLNQNKQTDKALVVLQEVTKKFPDYLSSVVLLGNIYLESGNKGKVLELYTKTMRYLDNNPQAKYQLQGEIERIRAL